MASTLNPGNYLESYMPPPYKESQYGCKMNFYTIDAIMKIPSHLEKVTPETHLLLMDLT